MPISREVSKLEVGQSVTLQLKDGRWVSGTFGGRRGESLIVDRESYLASDIQAVRFEDRRVSAGRTALLLVGTGAVLVIFFVEVVVKGFAEGAGDGQ